MRALNTALNWTHDRDHVRLLQHAHADHIESIYRSMLTLPGNPCQVSLQQFGAVRTFIADGERLENRAIFTGEETDQQINEVLQHFADHEANCVIEVNPANFYVDPPANWSVRLLSRLLARGCNVDGFRCVWVRSGSFITDQVPIRHRWVHFGPDDMDRYIETSQKVKPDKKWTPIERQAIPRPGWCHHVGYDAERPCALVSLFSNGRTGYLAWGYTHPDYRRRGLHQEGIACRLREASNLGCRQVFTVTDFNITSPRNLQRCGFHLAYNYLLVRRDPVPLA